MDCYNIRWYEYALFALGAFYAIFLHMTDAGLI